MINRLVSLGNVIIDIVAEVPALPERSGDVLASGVALEVGGGFNLMATAARQGLDVAYAGALGHGLFSDLARRELRAVGIALLLPDAPGEQRDTGFDLVLLEPGGERTFVTAVGAEAGVTSQRLDHVEIRPTDALLISGYGLLHDANRHAILAAATELLARLRRGNVVVRLGMSGCLVAQRGSEVAHVPGVPVTIADTTGAGDAHLGAFIAWLAAGRDPEAAARRANVVAAVTVTRRGPATSPNAEETDRFSAGS